MVRSFLFRMAGQSLADFRGSSDLFAGLFRNSPIVFALQRLNLLSPDHPSLSIGKDSSASSGALADRDAAAASEPRPLEAPEARPLGDTVALSALLPGTLIAVMDGPPLSPFEQLPPGYNIIPQGGRYQIQYLNGFDDPMVVDTLTMEILPGHATDPQLGGGSADTLLLAGPFDAPATLPLGLFGLETVALQGGASYDLTAIDSHVDAGRRLTIDARDLDSDDSVRFDAGSERDGAFLFLGGAGDDIFVGGAGNDRIVAGAGADSLRGGGGADTFVYNSAGESTGSDHDTLLGFNAADDRIDLPVAVSGFSAAVTSGALSEASFDSDLAAALGGLGAGRAAFFSPTAGDLAGTLFLVVDGNGVAGYQAGQDFVFALPGGSISDLGTSTAIFV